MKSKFTLNLVTFRQKLSYFVLTKLIVAVLHNRSNTNLPKLEIYVQKILPEVYMCRFVDSNINFPQCIHPTISREIFTLYINKTKKQLASHFKSTNSPKTAITLCPKDASINGTMG